MAYSTIADLRKRLTETELRQLTDLDENGSVNAEVVTRAIQRADSLINSCLEARYQVPVASPPDVLGMLSVNISIYFLMLDRNSVTEDARHQHDKDVQLLRDIAKGVVKLDVDPLPTESASGAGGQYDAHDKVWDRDDLDTW